MSEGVAIGSCAALYVRVSTTDQDLEGQERDLRRYAESRGWVVAQVYREKVSARGYAERVQYDTMERDARNPTRPWSRLLVWSLDRWSRNDRFTKAIASVEELEALRVTFHSYREPMIDTSEDGSPNMGRDLLRAILPVIAKFESIRREERVRVAMRELKEGRRRTRSGKPVGRPWRVTQEKADQILRLRTQGLTWKAIAQRVGLPAGTCSSVGSRDRAGALRVAPRLLSTRDV